jgi:hypothetical protein
LSTCRRISTRCWPSEVVKSLRERAWRNLLVAAINAALERKLLTLDPPRNLWPGAGVSPDRSEAHIFAFDIGGVPALAWLDDAGWDEVAVHACCLPTADGTRWIRCGDAGLVAGQAFACSWLERRAGRYLMDEKDLFWSRQRLIPMLAQVDVQPMGYADHGRCII